MRTTGQRNKPARRIVGVAAAAILLAGIPAIARHGSDSGAGDGSITLTTASRFTFTRPARSGDPLGFYQRKDGHSFAGVLGTTTGTTEPTAVDANSSTTTPTPTPTPSTSPTASAVPTTRPGSTPSTTIVAPLTLATPAGVFPVGAVGSFAEPVDLTAYNGLADPTATIRVSDGTSSTTIDAALYQQVVTNIRAVRTAIPGTANVTITATVTDQYGLPVVGAPLRIVGQAAGTTGRVDQLGVTNALGTLTFTGPGAGTGPIAPTGYATGSYQVYADLNVSDSRGSKEPTYEVIVGTVSYAAPGRAFYHNDKRIKKAGGVYADAARGTRAAHAKGYTWIDQDGQLVFQSRNQKLAGAARISQATELVWVNAHGSPFNPKWLKKGRFETKTWSAIQHRPGLRDAAATLRQNAQYGLSVEWEVKDVRPFTKAATLDAAFANLAALAKQYYGSAWHSRVEIKVLSNLSGGQKYALKVLKHAHAAGFTTMFLSRGRTTGIQIPASAQTYVTYVRGAHGGLYPAIPSAAQNAPVVVSTPPRRK
ncbi:hypothetical protein [Nocardioides sp. Iso805N]|uniref:hypothetical protein n=1 Tax=Nocardioides sp. Iso805N TaxID=1283287 RepID=UPI0003A0450B|nr:hypothetical protein [Nocardioides sp. Iso805N]